jgi:hypothetical protein
MSKSVLVTAAASGVLSLIGGQAHADAVGDSTVSNSPGVVSGNSAQVPVHVPVNICGNTVNVIGLLNPAFGNKCANKSGVRPAGNGATADSAVSHSPGVVSGNSAQVPVHVPVNLCGNTADLVAGLNPAFGNDCANGTTPVSQPPADQPPADEPPADEPPADEPPADEPPADEPPADEPPADEPPVSQPPSKPTTPSKPKPTKPTQSKPKPAKPAGKPTGKPLG